MIINGRELTAENPFIVAEVGSNWRDWDDVKNSVNLAKNCGADAVKFQYFTRMDLYGIPPTHEIYSGLPPYLHHGWLKGLKEKADAAGIELMCSAFSVDGLEFVNQFVNVHKVASSENNHIRMLEKLNTYGKPVLISTGGSSHGDIAVSMDYLGAVDVCPLYCVSDYPARTINFDEMDSFKSFRNIVGFSDHSTDCLVIPKAAVQRGAVVIEKHVNFFGVESPDSPHSLNTDEFKKMCDVLRGKTVSGSGQQDMVKKHNRRLIAIQDINPGDIFVEGKNFGIFRSLKEDLQGLSPFAIENVKGKTSKITIKAGDSIPPAALV